MGVEKKVHPTSLYFYYDEFCDLLGGATWEEAVERWRQAGLPSDREELLARFSSRFSSPPRSLFSDPRLYPLEVLWLKWSLFTQLCERMASFYHDFRRPHLNIQPAKVSVAVPEAAGDFLPSRWNFSLNLVDLETVVPASGEIPSEFERRIFPPPSDLHPEYSVPMMRGASLGHEESVTALIHSLERFRETADKSARGMAQVNLISDNIRPSDYSEMDLFRVAIKLPQEVGQKGLDSSVRIWGSKLPDSERGLLVSGTTEAIPLPLWEALERSRNAVFSYSRVAIYKSYQVPCDLYSLGVMLLRTFFVNDRQELPAVDRIVKEMVERLEPMVQGLGSQDDRIVADRLRESFQKEGKLFEKGSVLYRWEDRTGGGDAIPDDIWDDQLILALKLLAWIPGFSFCRDHGDYQADRPEGSIAPVVSKVKELGHRIKIELFGSRERNREILEACAHVKRAFFSAGNGSHAF